jgi:cytochrome c oxidase subunit II
MAIALAILIWILTLAIVLLFAGKFWWFPQLLSQYIELDDQFNRTFLITGVAFIISHIGLGYAVLRYHSRRKGEASYSHGNTKLEILWTGLIAVVFISIAFFGQRTWVNLQLNKSSSNAIEIEATGQQFVWVFRYPGPDGKFGKTDIKNIDDQDNPLGLVLEDPNGKDDVVSRGKLVVPINREINLILRSKDVTHSFFVPELRFKQDMVPGMRISVSFTATRVGNYEIACAELCGHGHYKMRGVFEVKESSDYDSWLNRE